MLGMYKFDEEPERTNHEIALGLLKKLRKTSASMYGLKERMPYTYLLEGTALQRRQLCLGYNTNSIAPGKTVMLTGQCIVKDDEELECPVTLEDALECEKLKEILQKSGVPSVCIYPDSTYADFSKSSGKNIDRKTIERATEAYVAFRTSALPEIIHVKTSEYEDKIKETVGSLDMSSLAGKVRRVYGGRLLRPGQSHSLQNTIIEYGLKAAVLPCIVGLTGECVVTFAEPDEICSVLAAEMVGKELEMPAKFSLIGQIPLPSMSYTSGFGDIRMYSAGRERRIHLNECNETIRAKFEQDTDILLVALYMSPLTTEDELEIIGKSLDRREGMDVMMQQIEKFRKHLG